MILTKPYGKLRYALVIATLGFALVVLPVWLVGQEDNQQNANNQTEEQADSDGEQGEDNALFKPEDFVPLDMQEEMRKRLYPQILLDDFENSTYRTEDIRFQYGGNRWASVKMMTAYPAPIRDSKRYLGIKVHGKRENAVQVYPPKPILIDDYALRLNIWVYGKGLSGALYVVVKDRVRNTHLIQLGLLNYRGWRRLSARIPDQVLQTHPTLNREEGIKVVSFVYNPGNKSEQNKWNYVYLDDFTATVREKYTDRQSDNW